jgi:tRNA threonylcarbamoyladenosine biosynthesis protein TsaB
MRLLALETATDLVGAALWTGDGAGAPSVVERTHVGGRAHAELLAPAIEEVCAASGCVLADVDALAVDIGPGLFTGLRVGVATAKALGQALGLGLLGVTSLDVLAAAAVEQAGPERTARVVSVVDARRGEVFAAAYELAGSGADPADVRTDRPEPLTPEALAAWLDELAASGGPLLVVGDGAVRHRDVLAGRAGIDLGLAQDLAAPSPAALARLAARRLAAGVPPVAAADLAPEYRRAPDAKINWEERAPLRTARPAADGAP